MGGAGAWQSTWRTQQSQDTSTHALEPGPRCTAPRGRCGHRQTPATLSRTQQTSGTLVTAMPYKRWRVAHRGKHACARTPRIPWGSWSGLLLALASDILHVKVLVLARRSRHLERLPAARSAYTPQVTRVRTACGRSSWQRARTRRAPAGGAPRHSRSQSCSPPGRSRTPRASGSRTARS